ncbi:MAG: aldo/keto reductase [Clostridiales bacterium]|jgi:predicted aldo/keto reductase-like oxidoreductase|nr:aldo/keto reductase [Clostridiales bacterium]
MLYRENPKNSAQISLMGYGCMRFPKDDAELLEQLRLAIELGVNYFDTAYIYPRSERRLGQALAALGGREKVNIATKLPIVLARKTADFDGFLNKQLERLRTGYIDYYLMHMLGDLSTWEKLVSLGIEDWLAAKKAGGQIKNIGFSYHGGRDEFPKILDSYPWDFCMLQYNYFDKNAQAGESGLKYAASKGVPVVIMEPLRGGVLAKLPEKTRETFRAGGVSGFSDAALSLRWLFAQPEILTVLSGMNTTGQIEENAALASAPVALSPAELAVYDDAAKSLRGLGVPCTGCAYCMPCPRGVDIPLCLSCYNNRFVEGPKRAKTLYLLHTLGRNASLCASCGVCAKRCPQKIDIPKQLKTAAASFEGLLYKPLSAVLRRVFKLRRTRG